MESGRFFALFPGVSLCYNGRYHMVTNIIAIIAILVTVSSAAWYKTLKEVREEVKNSSAPSPLAYTESLKSTSRMLAVSSNAIYIGEQFPGAATTVSMALLEAPGFVVIHENGGDEPGKIIGISELLAKGESRNVVIPLSKNTREGDKLWVALYLDNGDKKFSPEKDKPAQDRLGHPVMMAVIVGKEEDLSESPPEISP